MLVLGVSAFYHDSAAALIQDGNIVAAVQEERFSRIKHDSSFPSQAIRYCLNQNKCTLSDVDAVVFYEKPVLKLERILRNVIEAGPGGFRAFMKMMPEWAEKKAFHRGYLTDLLRQIDQNFQPDGCLMFSEHHLSHAASAFYPSPFEKAAVVTVDGVGEWATTTLGFGEGRELSIKKQIEYPNSLGLLYSAFTQYCGFRVNSGEYKLMGLAPYGTPHYVDLILDNVVDIKDDGSFSLNAEYFGYRNGERMISDKFTELLGRPERAIDSDRIDRFYMDVAASIQKAIELAMEKIVAFAVSTFETRNVCLAGGVALNCVSNGRLLRSGVLDNLWVQPAAGDAGGALGAAYAAYHLHFKGSRTKRADARDAMRGSYLGPSVAQVDTGVRLKNAGAKFEEFDEPELLAKTAEALAAGLSVGWIQGDMEFGPRALGNRSILADPRSKTTQKTLNLQIKYRESFRPFAPAVIAEAADQWFDLNTTSPYMLIVADVLSRHLTPDEGEAPADTGDEDVDIFGIINRSRSSIPAVTHVDGSARVQTVDAEQNPKFHKLLKAFEEKTGCPILVNTSFNIRGEPIVCTPEDAFRCFMGCELDVLVVDRFWMEKTEQSGDLKSDYRDEFRLD